MRFASLAVIGALAITAHADPTAIVGDDNVVHGFVWQGEESIDGTVTDPHGHALPNAQVHVVTNDVERVVATDRDGRYHVTPKPGAAVLVFVHGDVRITSTAAISHAGGDGETVDMREREAPATPPKVKRRPKRPAYSDAATDRNAWIRAWLLLDIDETGNVVRVKLLDRPGYDLDAIAIASAFAVDFEPARDRANRPIRTQLLWSIDWPPFWWLLDEGGSVTAPIPDAALSLPCRDDRGVHPPRLERSCAPAPIANALSLPWITR